MDIAQKEARNYSTEVSNKSPLVGFHASPLVLGEFEFGDLGFSERRKPGVPGEKPSEHGENQHQTQPKYGIG